MELPDADIWKFESPKNKSMFQVVQRNKRGQRLRVLRVMGWKSDTKLTMPDGDTVPTGDTKKLAQATLASMDQSFGFEEIERRSKIKRVRLHKDFSDVQGVQAEGFSSDGRWFAWTAGDTLHLEEMPSGRKAVQKVLAMSERVLFAAKDRLLVFGQHGVERFRLHAGQ